MIKYSFEDKVAVVTGAGVGIGYEIAHQLASAGAAVVLNDIDPERATSAAQKISASGGLCLAVCGDAGEMSTIQNLISTATEKFGAIDYAIANAGITTFGSFLKYSQEDFQKLLNLNLKGSFFLAQAVSKEIIKQKNKGRIIFMSSVTGFTFHPDLAAYGMSKAALSFLAKTLGVDLAQYQITVNAVAPGATNTQRTLDLADGNYVKTWENITPNGRCAVPEDIASATLFLLSDQAQHITGQTLIIDGGWTSTSPSP